MKKCLGVMLMVVAVGCAVVAEEKAVDAKKPKAEVPEAVVADDDKEGAPDVVATNAATVKPVVVEGEPFFKNGFLLKGSGNNVAAYDAALGDVNGDGWLDLMIVHGGFSPPIGKDGKPFGSGINMLYLHNGTAKPFDGVDYIELPNPHRDTRTCAFGDLNGDGKLDYVLGGANGTHGMNAIAVSYNNGTAKPFTSETNLSDKAQIRGVAILDMNGDKTNDVVATWGSRTGSPLLFLNNGDGTFAQKHIAPEDKWATSGIHAVDVNGDGHPDVITAGGNNKCLPRLYLNNGTADPFKDVKGQNIGGVRRQSYQFELGDLNGDGKPDIVLAGPKGPSIYFNTGNKDKPFADSGEGELIGEERSGYSFVTMGDADGDGYLDVVACATDCSPVPQPIIFINNGSKTPFKDVKARPLFDTPEPAVHYGPWNILMIIFNDINKDGTCDMISMQKWGGVKLFLGTNDAKKKADGEKTPAVKTAPGTGSATEAKSDTSKKD